jgi:hypothetical protein
MLDIERRLKRARALGHIALVLAGRFEKTGRKHLSPNRSGGASGRTVQVYERNIKLVRCRTSALEV